MAAPNLLTLTTVTGKSVGAAATTSGAALLTNAAASGKVFKIDRITVANVDGANAADISISHRTGVSGTPTVRKLAHTVSIPADASLQISGPIYLEEDSDIYILASANGDLDVTASYLEMV